MKIKILSLALTALLLAACDNNKPPETTRDAETTSPAAATDMSANDTAATALDWPGEYKGVLPCSDCQGIETELELKMDKTYELSEEFLGRANGQESKITGTFEFDPNDPAVIILDQAANNRKFFVGENFIEARDVNNGDNIDASQNYRLQKDLQ